MDRTAAQHVAAQVADWGCEYIFGLAGNTVIPLLEGLRQTDEVTYVGVRHEESAGFMASTYAKMTGRLGLCLAEGGPGAVHLLNGVYDARMDRVPVLALTGETARKRLGTHWPQTVNQDLLYEDATCYNHTAATGRQVPDVLFEAMRRAEMRSAPVRLGLPLDVQTEGVQGPIRERPAYLDAYPSSGDTPVKEAAEHLQKAKRPVVFVGQGARGQRQAVLDVAAHLQAGIVHTMPAIGIIPAGHSRNLGVIGDFGTEAAARALGQADVVLVLGSTWWQPQYLPDATYIQIDQKRRHLGMTFPTDVGITASIADVLPPLLQALEERGQKGRDRWESHVRSLAEEWDQAVDQREAAVSSRDSRLRESDDTGPTEGADGDEDAGRVVPQRLVAALQEHLDGDAVVCLDVGDNTFWISSLFQAAGQRVLVSGHWRSMGYALPAAIAAHMAAPGRQVVAVTGDGGFTMTMAELGTAVAHDVPVTAVVLNNGVLGEEGHEQRRMNLEPFGVSLHNPDFKASADAWGARGYRIGAHEELDRLEEALAADGPAVVDVAVEALMPSTPRARGTLKPSPPSKAQRSRPLRV